MNELRQEWTPGIELLQEWLMRTRDMNQDEIKAMTSALHVLRGLKASLENGSVLGKHPVSGEALRSELLNLGILKFEDFTGRTK